MERIPSMKHLPLWFAILLTVSWTQRAAADGGWRTGRATFFGINWSIHHGSCGYGNIDWHRNTGWDVAAISNKHYEYQGSCGKCYEIKCEPMGFNDGYGQYLDRKQACYDPNKTVKVAIVDSCPCYYPKNHYSNKRWCCQDMDHLDISYTAYDKLADRKWGVIGLKYRPIECPDSSYLPRKNHYPPDTGRRLKTQTAPFALHPAGDDKSSDFIVLEESHETASKAMRTLKEYIEVSSRNTQ